MGGLKISCSLTSHNKVQVLVVCFLLVGRLEEANLTLSSLMVPGRAETNYPPKGEMMGNVNSSEGDSSSFCVTDSLKLRPRSHGNSFLQGFFNAEVFQFHFRELFFSNLGFFPLKKKLPENLRMFLSQAFQNCSQKNTATCGNVQSLGLMGKKKRYEKSPQGIAKQNGAPEPLKISCDLTSLGRRFFEKNGVPGHEIHEMNKKYREKYLKMIHERHELI